MAYEFDNRYRHYIAKTEEDLIKLFDYFDTTDKYISSYEQSDMIKEFNEIGEPCICELFWFDYHGSYRFNFYSISQHKDEFVEMCKKDIKIMTDWIKEREESLKAIES